MSRRKRHHRHTPPGTPPGTLIADPNAPRPVIRLMAYGRDEYTERTVDDLESIPQMLARWPVTWINVDGLGEVATIARLGEILNLHQLAIEDTVNTYQRTKAEQYSDHLFMVMQMVTNGWNLETEQLSLFLGDRFVVTFQQGRPGDPFDTVRERIRKGGGHLRQAGPEYLAYALIDAVIDGYFPVLEHLGERLENLEDQILLCATPQSASHVHHLRRELMALRRAVWPLRDALNTLIRDPNPLIGDETRLYLRDCYDHTVRILDFIETYRELGSNLVDLYLSSMSQRMNEVMKVLTIIATIFIPLTFIVGIYGMNFDPARSPFNMPELEWYYGYPIVLGIMAVIAVGMLLFFRHKGWIGPASKGSVAVVERDNHGQAGHPPEGGYEAST
ncbi:MAG TPA: magnesium/cobalt transporter CorA [Phycisphaerae bacterium]|nr:magnesium/cobalt transporter CorA [Phycisphaerae bacterium]HOJ73424.1 magnesium/cobalt transporter CorA [Phycisphaerae bacterium]HOM51033.1 magnesium/cobalt transporter CorA [Phycisphaerae bacterium]HOQ85192.1 magnesium/cobalt transporter CorA [Phycisphaerae bacterium]HPP25738.1 magnesium/cobalt transporter CorA [Phycisphaerae bacterium]